MKWSYEYTFHNAVRGYLRRWVRLRLPTSAVAGFIVLCASIWFSGAQSITFWAVCIVIGGLVWLTIDYFVDMIIFKYRTVRSYRMTGSHTIRFKYANDTVSMEIGKERYSFALSDFSLLGRFEGMIILRRKKVYISNKLALWFRDNIERDKLYELVKKYYAQHEE